MFVRQPVDFSGRVTVNFRFKIKSSTDQNHGSIRRSGEYGRTSMSFFLPFDGLTHLCDDFLLTKSLSHHVSQRHFLVPEQANLQRFS